MSADITFFKFIPYFSPQVPVTISETVPPSLSMPLPTPASTVSSPVSLVETLDPPTSKPVQDFRYVYTHRPKIPAIEPVSANPTPVNGPPPPSASFSDLDIPIALRKDKQSCTDHPILFFMITLTPLFVSLPYHCLLSIPRSYT